MAIDRLVPYDRIPPQSLEMEQCALGAMLVERAAAETVAEILRATDFYRDAHRAVFEALLGLMDRDEPIDLSTLRDALTRSEQLDQVGGFPYLIQLTDAVPAAANAEYYARAVRDCADRRRMIDAAGQIMGLAHDGESPVETLIERAERAVFEIGERRDFSRGPVRVTAAVARAFEELERRGEAIPSGGVSTGLRALDRIIGPQPGGRVIILAARPSVGKTALAQRVASHVCRHRGAVLMYSLEMSADDLMLRLISMEARIEVRERMRPEDGVTDADWRRVGDVCAAVSEWPLYIDHSGDLTVAQMRNRARRLHAREHLALVIVDYLQLMAHGKPAERTAEVSNISRAVKLLAKELDVPVLALSQLNRESAGRANKRPMLSELRESGAIEQDADVAILMHSEDYYRQQEGETAERPEVEVVELNVQKHRHGRRGICRVAFYPRHVRFDDLEEGR